jgi:hypothetical protein
MALTDPQSAKDQEVGSRPAAAPSESKKLRKALSQARRVLTEEELSTPGAQKMLLDELDRLEEENGQLILIRDRFHDTDKNCAVLEQKLKQGQKDALSTDIIFTGSMTVGALVLGFLPSLFPLGAAYFVTAAVIGVVLMVIRIAAKIVKYQ